jgi:hypothetical protein
MSARGPDFDELVGDDISRAERDRLRRVHELLVAAGPPPDFEPAVPPAPPEASVTALSSRRSVRRRMAVVALAAAFLVAVFGVGYVAGHRGPGEERVVAMVGTARAPEARASLKLFSEDAAGNWPMKLDAKGLVSQRPGQAYELWLTKGGRLAALCGSFKTRADGSVDVRLNAPYRLTEYDAWVVVVEGSRAPLLTTA